MPRKMIFFMFGFTVENMKDNQSKFLKILHIFKILNFYIIEETNKISLNKRIELIY